jgi:hypothetical protein
VAGRSGWATLTYTGLDPDAYGDLYFSLIASPRMRTTLGSWLYLTSVTWGSCGACFGADRNFGIYDTERDLWRWYTPRFDIQDITGAGPVFAPGSNGIPASVGPSWAITGTSFSMRVRFTLSGSAAGLLFDTIGTRPNDVLQTWLDDPFWWNAPIPEPTTSALFGLGAAGLALHCRRRQQTSAG